MSRRIAFRSDDNPKNARFDLNVARNSREQANAFLSAVDGCAPLLAYCNVTYGIIWVSRFSHDPEAVRPFLQQLALRTRRGEDLIT